MARGRFISKEISLDEKVHGLSDDTVRLLFTWLIPHLDCEGRMHGDAQTVKSVVFPRRSISVGKIEKYLKELENFDLILRYSVNGNQYLCMKNFEKHQPGLRKDRESQSQIPAFTPELIRSNDGVNPAEVKDKVKDKDNKEKYIKRKYGDFRNVLLTDAEYQKLVSEFTEAGAAVLIDKLSRGKEAKGYKYKSDYAAILNWQRRDKDGKAKGRGLPQSRTPTPEYDDL